MLAIIVIAYEQIGKINYSLIIFHSNSGKYSYVCSSYDDNYNTFTRSVQSMLLRLMQLNTNVKRRTLYYTSEIFVLNTSYEFECFVK